MKAIHYYIAMAGAAALLLGSCVKDDLYDTPTPTGEDHRHRRLERARDRRGDPRLVDGGHG